MASKSPYTILGISPSATKGEIKTAYRALALAHHPDKVSPSDRRAATAKFQELQDAYEVCLEHLTSYHDHHDYKPPPQPRQDPPPKPRPQRPPQQPRPQYTGMPLDLFSKNRERFRGDSFVDPCNDVKIGLSNFVIPLLECIILSCILTSFIYYSLCIVIQVVFF